MAHEHLGDKPTISSIRADNTIVELLYRRGEGTTFLAVAIPGQAAKIVSHLEANGEERLVPYSAQNNLIAHEVILFPSDIGDFGDKGDLLKAIKAYLHRYVDLSPAFEDIAAHYVLLTWVYDAFNELPYLRFRGDYGTGKTRALMTLGSICYKPFFASGASTVSPIFHVLNAFGATLVLDEADLRFSDATADLTKILNNGTVRGMPILRTMANKHGELNPQAFRVFGPKIIGMRESFRDRALESRFLTEETGRKLLRTDIPIHLPRELKADALALRNRLLAWRFYARHRVEPDPSRLIAGIEPRLNQTALALLSLVDDEGTRDRIRRELVGEAARVLSERAATPEATMLSCLCEAFQQGSVAYVTVADITRRFNERNQAEFGTLMSPKWVGNFIRTKLRLSTYKTGGVYVVPCTDRAQLLVLAKRWGVTTTLATAA